MPARDGWRVMTAHTPAEWAAAGFLGLSAAGLLALLLAFADADVDPRPWLRRFLTAAHQGAVHAGHDLNRVYATAERLARRVLRDAALTVAALLTLLNPATPESLR